MTKELSALYRGIVSSVTCYECLVIKYYSDNPADYPLLEGSLRDALKMRRGKTIRLGGDMADHMTASEILRRKKELSEEPQPDFGVNAEFGERIKRLLEKYDIGSSRVDDEFGK